MHSRRHFIASTLALAAATGVSESSSQSTSKNPKTFVLVHGAWHGGWCWRYVRDHLERAGHRVYTPTLTGLGERSHLLNKGINLSTHVADVVNLIRFEQLDKIVLVGHSYAGVVVSLVADALKERISQLVFLDAVIPTNGQAFIPEAQREAILAKYGEDYVLPAGNLDFLGIPKDHKHARWVVDNLTPHPLGTFLEPVKMDNGGLAGVPKTFIRCMGNPRANNDPVLAITQDDPEWRYVTIDTGHDAMVTEPELLAKLLLD